MAYTAPFVGRIQQVEDQWTDYNGHFNMAYYNVLFDRAGDEAFAALGLGPDYVKERNASFFTLESHNTYGANCTPAIRCGSVHLLIAIRSACITCSRCSTQTRAGSPASPKSWSCMWTWGSRNRLPSRLT